MHKTAGDIRAMKGVERIAAVTAYDYALASLCDAKKEEGTGGIDVLLVGDSAAMVVLGQDGTTGVTVGQMCMFTSAVARARRNALVVADMPFMSYQPGAETAVRNAGRLVRAGADAVKIEGGRAMAPVLRAITDAGVPVMGHIGLQPQTSALSGGYRVQGRTAEAAKGLVDDARSLEEAGAFSIVLEMVAREAASAVTGAVGAPTIGIGSGAGCDGQVLVLHDLLGIYDRISPRFAKKYADLAPSVSGAVAAYAAEVKGGAFPAAEHSFGMDGGGAGVLAAAEGTGGGASVPRE